MLQIESALGVVAGGLVEHQKRVEEGPGERKVPQRVMTLRLFGLTGLFLCRLLEQLHRLPRSKPSAASRGLFDGAGLDEEAEGDRVKADESSRG